MYGGKSVDIEAEPIAAFLLNSMKQCESNGISVHHYADTLLNQPQLMFTGSALETVQQLRHNSHSQFRFRSAGGTYSNPHDNEHICRLAVTGIQKVIIEALEVTIDESVMKLLAKQLETDFTSDSQVKFNEYGINLMMLHKQRNEISNPADLLTTMNDAINRLDYRTQVIRTCDNNN